MTDTLATWLMGISLAAALVYGIFAHEATCPGCPPAAGAAQTYMVPQLRPAGE